MKNLRIYNAVMGVLHLIQGALVLWLSNSFALPVNSSYVEFEPVSKTLTPVLEKVFEVPIGAGIALFLFMSAAAHLLLTLPAVYN